MLSIEGSLAIGASGGGILASGFRVLPNRSLVAWLGVDKGPNNWNEVWGILYILTINAITNLQNPIP